MKDWKVNAPAEGTDGIDAETGKHDIMRLFDELSFREKWKRVSRGLKQPKESGDHKWAKLQVLRLLSPVAAVVVPVLILALITILAQLTPEPVIKVQVNVVEPEPMEELEEIIEPESEPPEPPEPTEVQMHISADMPSLPTETVTPPAEVASVQPAEFDSVAMVKSPVIMQGMLGSRNPGSRGAALASGGGSSATEAAVLRALRWLKTTQSSDGSWKSTSGGAAPNPGGELYTGTPQAFTGLALLCFLAHGETPASDEFGETVESALKWLLTKQGNNGTFGIGYVLGTDLGYSHFIATYALCEAAALTRVPDVVYAAEKGVQRILDAQHDNGGWDYDCRAGARVDVSVISWAVQSLKAARMAQLSNEGIKEALDKAGVCFRKVLFDQRAGVFHYDNTKTQSAALSGLSCTAVLSLQLIGSESSSAPETRQGVEWLKKNARFSWSDPWGRSPLYYCYYTTQVMFHEGGQAWNDWNRQFSPELVQNQTVVKGKYNWKGQDLEIGFWGPVDRPAGPPEYCQAFVYNTTLCALSLMVYYRYLPTFKAVEADDPVSLDDGSDIEITFH